MKVDFGKTATDYAKHRLGFPDAFFERLFAAGHVRSGDRCLDVGTGPGTVARQLAKRGAIVTGLDPAQSLMDEAARLDAAAGVRVDYVVGKAEDTGLPAAQFDVVTAGQCWHWFDRPKAAQEVRRVLKPGGTLVIRLAAVAGKCGPCNRAADLGAQSGLEGRRRGLYPRWLSDAAQAGFADIETFSFDVAPEYTRESWRGRIRASAGVAASLPPEAVDKFDAALAALLAKDFPEPLRVPHRVWAMTARAPR
jgi:SAM-dependent methyltransferase